MERHSTSGQFLGRQVQGGKPLLCHFCYCNLIRHQARGNPDSLRTYTGPAFSYISRGARTLLSGSASFVPATSPIRLASDGGSKRRATMDECCTLTTPVVSHTRYLARSELKGPIQNEKIQATMTAAAAWLICRRSPEERRWTCHPQRFTSRSSCRPSSPGPWPPGWRSRAARAHTCGPDGVLRVHAYGRSRQAAVSVSVPWAPGLNLSLSFHLDGLSLLFAILITGVGTLIVLYAGEYLEDHPHAGRFQVFAVRLHGLDAGLVLSDNVIALFVFWELTGFTSYLLIGFEHERPEARRAATAGAARHRRWRPGAAGGGAPARAGGGTAQLVRAGRQRLACAADPLYAGIVAPRSARGVHQVRAVPVPLLAAERDAGADAGQRVPALGDDGEGGRLPGRANDADRSAARRSGPAPITVVGAVDDGRRGRAGRCSRPTSSACWRIPRSARSAC